MERRFTTLNGANIVTDKRADGTVRITGYAAMFYRADDPGTEYFLHHDIIERISSRAFDRAIQEAHDVRGLFNHDANFLLGRSAANTLRLFVDAKGLKYEIDSPDTQAGRDVETSIKRGDLTGSSFSFAPTKVTWHRDDKRKADIRVIEDVTLYDVGPVTFPAYEATTTGTRSTGADDVIAARDAWRLAQLTQSKKVEARLKLLTIDTGYA